MHISEFRSKLKHCLMTEATTQLKKLNLNATKYEEPSEVPITDGMMIHPPYLEWDKSRLTYEKPFDISKLVSAPNTFISSATYNYPATETCKGGKGPLRIEFPYDDESMCFSTFGITDQLEQLTPAQVKLQDAGQTVTRKKTGKKVIRISIPVDNEVCGRLRDVVFRDIYEVAMDHLHSCGSSDDGNGILSGTFLKTLERSSDPVGPDNPYSGFQYPVLFQKKDVEISGAGGTIKTVKRSNTDFPGSIGAAVLTPEDPSKAPVDGKKRRAKGPSVFILDDKTNIPLSDLEDRGFYHSPEIGVGLFIGATTKVKFTLYNSIVTGYLVGNQVGRLQAIESRSKNGISTGASMRNRAALFAKSSVADPNMTDETDEAKKTEEAKVLADKQAADELAAKEADEDAAAIVAAKKKAAAKKVIAPPRKTPVKVDDISEEGSDIEDYEEEQPPVQVSAVKQRTVSARTNARSRFIVSEES